MHPLYTEKDLVLDDRILGEWLEGDSPDSWHFSKIRGKNEKAYVLKMTQEDGKGFYFQAHLLKLGGQFYLDFFPSENNSEYMQENSPSYFPEDFHESLWWPMHTFAKIEVDNDTLSISFFDPEWIEDLIKESKIRIKHEKVSDTYVLTASTKELQKFVMKYGQSENALEDKMTMKRKL